MKKLVLLLLLPILSNSQTDTIFKKDKSTIICTITFANNDNIFYSEKKDPGKFIEVKKVSLYSQNGKRTDPSLIKVISSDPSLVKPTSTEPSLVKVIAAPHLIDTISATLEIEHMKYCFRRFSKEYYTGVIVGLAGFGISGIGLAIARSDENAGFAIAGAGFIATLVGGIIMIDSHRWLHKAGFGINGKGNSVSIYYTFK